MATRIKTKKGLKSLYENCSEEVRHHFAHLPKLLEEFPMDVCLAYVFARVEFGQNMALYCGSVRVHRVNAEIARNAVGTHHMTRESFIQLYKTVFDCDLPKSAHADLKTAERIRDLIMHGKGATSDQIRNAIARALEYADEVNSQLNRKHGLRPFGSLKGFAGRAKKLDTRTSRFLLKGLGFTLS